MNMRLKHICGIVAFVLLCTALAKADLPAAGQAAPQWKTGDSWRVGAWHWQVYRPEEQAQMGTHKVRGRAITVLFEVVGEATVNKTLCYKVKVTFPKEETGFKRILEVFYAKDTGKLLRVHDVSQIPGGSTKDLTTDLVMTDKGPVFPDDVPGAVPLEWPDLTQQNVTAQADAAVATAQTVTSGVQSSGGTGAQEDEVTLTKSCASRQSKVVQHWRKGDPWWRTAQKYSGDKLVGEAVLLEVNGQTVATMPAADSQ